MPFKAERFPYQAARAQVARLTPALLAKAFRSELVPQYPTDEPTAVLLERLRGAARVWAKALAQPLHPWGERSSLPQSLITACMRTRKVI